MAYRGVAITSEDKTKAYFFMSTALSWFEYDVEGASGQKWIKKGAFDKKQSESIVLFGNAI